MILNGEKAHFDVDDPATQVELSALGRNPDDIGPFVVFGLHSEVLHRLSSLSLDRSLGDRRGDLLRHIEVVRGLHDRLQTQIQQLGHQVIL